MDTPDQGHIVKSFDEELRRQKNLLAEMGGLVESQTTLAREALLRKDTESASRAIELDPRVDALAMEAEQTTIRMLALRQPMAIDLRRIVGTLKIANELERVGDYATNVAKRSLVLQQFPANFSMNGVSRLSRGVQENLKAIIDAVGEDDADRAAEVWRSDESLDDIYNGIFRELVTHMMEDVRNITPATHLLFIAKNLERMGDHATNIAETLYYAVKGERLPAQRPKGDTSAYAVVRAPGE
jgi:phosphate transport system protein